MCPGILMDLKIQSYWTRFSIPQLLPSSSASPPVVHFNSSPAGYSSIMFHQQSCPFHHKSQVLHLHLNYCLAFSSERSSENSTASFDKGGCAWLQALCITQVLNGTSQSGAVYHLFFCTWWPSLYDKHGFEHFHIQPCRKGEPWKSQNLECTQNLGGVEVIPNFSLF